MKGSGVETNFNITWMKERGKSETAWDDDEIDKLRLSKFLFNSN